VSFTTVASFESVGAILVVAFLIVPPATAYLLTERFKTMLMLTVFLSIIISITGYYLAVYLDASIAGAMATMAGVFFIAAFGYHLLKRNAGSKDIKMAV
jgi:manganese/zinc/iron transport system permease protein